MAVMFNTVKQVRFLICDLGYRKRLEKFNALY